MRALRTVALVLPLVLGTGCFVFDEIDKGNEMIDAHSARGNQKKREAAAAAAAGGAPAATKDGKKPPTYQQLVNSWWKDAMTLSSEPTDPDAASDPMIACAHQGRTLYTKRSDCLARGGRPG